MSKKLKPLTRKRAVKLTVEDELVALTRDVERLRRERRKWARKLKATTTELRAVRREQRALLARIKTERAPDIMPSRLTAGATGYRRPAELDAPAETTVSTTTSDFVDGLNEE